MQINKREQDKLGGAERSPKWPAVRKSFLVGKSCAVCGRKKNLQAHHIRPFHLHPELELDPSNLITLCENGNPGIDCHLIFGHLGNFRTKYNVTVVQDAASWNVRLTAKMV